MARQIRQVLMTYVTHYWVLAGIAAWLLIAVPLQLIAVTPKDIVPFITTCVAAPLMFVSPMLVLQVKAQFAHPRSVLTPHFRQPHIVVASLAIVCWAVVYPLLIAWCSGLDPLGMIALASSNAAMWTWAHHRVRFWTIIVCIAAFLIQMTPAGTAWWVLDATSHRLVHAAIIVAAAGLLAAWLMRVSHLREEMEAYHNSIHWAISRRSEAEDAERRRKMAQCFGGNRLVWWYFNSRFAAFGYHQGSRWAIARLLRLSDPFPAELIGLILTPALVIIIPIVPFMLKRSGETRSGFEAATFYAQMAALLPAFASELLAQRRPRVAADYLFPLSRGELIAGLFRAAFWNAAILLLMANIGLVLFMWLTGGDDFNVRAVAIMLVATSTCAFAFFCLGLRTANWRSATMRFGVEMAAIMVLSPISLFLWFVPHGRNASVDGIELPLMAASAVVAIVGAALLYDAHRVWMKAELG